MLTAENFDIGEDPQSSRFRGVPHPSLTVYARRRGPRLVLTLGYACPTPYKPESTKGYTVEWDDDPDHSMSYVTFAARTADLNTAFLAVMSDALDRSTTAEDQPQALEAFFSTIEEFRTLTAVDQRKMRAEELRGAIAELIVLRRLIDAGMDPDKAVEAWRGPYRSAYDFVFDADTALEVKSIHIGAALITISNVEQLDPDISSLALAVCPVEEATADSAGSFTPTSLIEALYGSVGPQSQTARKLDRALEALGLDDLESGTGDRWFTAGAAAAYRVSAGFPRIPRSAVPAEVRGLKYQLSLSSLERFKIPFVAFPDTSQNGDPEDG